MRRRQHTRAPRPAGGAPAEVAVVEGLQQLIELQKLDAELATHEEEHASLPARREALAAQQAEAEAQLAAGREALRAAELEQRQAEAALRDREAVVAKLEGQQFQVKTNEAYTTLLREIDHAREASSVCETKILEAMEAIEARSEAAAAAEAALKLVQERAVGGCHALDSRESELDARIGALRVRRGDVRSGVPRELAELYDRIAKRRRPAVVTITREICVGCRVDIPPQTLLELRRRERIVCCGRCQRILVYGGE
jgi:predicted  nucleic acid-binding Zn-ribbon protein